MNGLTNHIDDLDRMVDAGNTPKHELRSQIAFIGREVAALQADYARLAEAHATLQDEHSKFKAAQTPPPIDVPVDLDEAATEMLVFIAGRAQTTKSQIMAQFPQSSRSFDELIRHNFVGCASFNIAGKGGAMFYEANPKGRDYLSRKGLS